MANHCHLYTTIYSLSNDAAGKELLHAVPRKIATQAATLAGLSKPAEQPFEAALYTLSFNLLKKWCQFVVDTAPPDAVERSASFPVRLPFTVATFFGHHASQYA